MTNANLSALSMTELKALAAESGAIPTGDKRSKQSWIAAIESVALVAAPDDDTLEDIRLCPHPEGLTDLCEEDDTFDVDDWDAPVALPDAEMEAIAHAADIAPKKAAKSLSALIKCELGESALEQTDFESIEFPESAPAPKKVLISKSEHSAAVLIFGTLLCALVLVFRVVFGVGDVVLKLGSYVVRSFGKYDPDLDLGWQFAQFRCQRSAPVTA